MIVSIGADHGGYQLKIALIKALAARGYTLKDRGTDSDQSVDYPLFAKRVARDVQSKAAQFGILICTTGIGMSITANKVPGVRAALVSNQDAAQMTRLHNDSNVICLGAKYTTLEEALNYCEIFLTTQFLGERHARRVALISELEEESTCQEKL